mgnify:CR=1 FL=1|tara:strand:+ start:551 stop:1576 length:1026 start_codon:yes stop_codon:yes gene_type:complete
MAKLADSDISVDQGRVYNIGGQTIFYFSFFTYFPNNADYYSKEIAQQLSELKKYSLVIADFSKERMDHDPLYDVLEQLGLNFVMLTHNITRHQCKPKLFYYPVLYHWVRYQFRRVYKTSIETFQKTYKMSCLNRVSRWHRVYNYLLLQSHKRADDFLLTMHNHGEITDAWELYTRSCMPHELMQQWETIKNQLPHDIELNRTKTRPDWDIVHLAYTDSYINLVTETDMSDTAFVTEKTWKPIASAQLFLIVGHKNAVAHLRDMGVDTFDDVINHAHYDYEPDWQIRIQKIHQVLDELLTQDLESIYKATQQRRITNAEKFFNGDFGTKYQTDLLTCITTLK